MAPFLPPTPVISGFKEKVDSIAVQGDRLYLGTATGTLHIYSIDDSPSAGNEQATVVDVKPNLSRKSIEQLGFIKDVNSLVVLSDMTVTLFPLPTLAPPTTLPSAKGATFSFALRTFVKHLLPNGKPEAVSDVKSPAIPTLFTYLLLGCRRRAILYSWKDGEAQPVKEAPLPHSPRTIVFVGEDVACFAYSTTEFAIFTISTMTAVDVSIPPPATAPSTAMSAFTTGLTGYMTLGLGPKAKPSVIHVGETEALVLKDHEGIFIGPDAKPSRPTSVEWPVPPEELAFVKPYIFSLLPSSTADATTPAIQIRSSTSLISTQTLPFPFTSSSSPAPHAALRLLTTTPSPKAPLLLVSTPTDRNVAASEGRTIWQFYMKSWPEQIDELVQAGAYSEALALLDTIEQPLLSDKEKRRVKIRALNAVSEFHAGKFDVAIDAFIELDITPAKVVALYPEVVAGRLAVPQSKWISLFDGPEAPPAHDAGGETPPSRSSIHSSTADKENPPTVDAPEATSGTTGTLRGRLKGLGALIGQTVADDSASVRSRAPSLAAKNIHDDLHRSVETLVRFLSNLRPKVDAALAAVGITPAKHSHEITPLSEIPKEELFTLPNAALSALTPEQLLRFAQIIYTALFKSYLVVRPGLIGPLCRVENWCEVGEVEEELRARQKFAELKDLYNGKKMHSKALELLRELSEKEEDMVDKLQPSISYLQKLGPQYLDQIFETSKWVLEQDKDMGFEIFASEEVDLPRPAVANFLENIDPALCARYLEYLINDRAEESSTYHDRLAELYIKMTLTVKRRGDEGTQQAVYQKLLKFIDTTSHYRVDRLYGLLSSEDLFEARAMLLGKLGRHGQALELYVYRLQDFFKAEEYCMKYYRAGTETSTIYLQLLRIYLRPTVTTDADLLRPALDLISRHSPRLDPVETIHLLPPLVTAQDVRTFLFEALRAPVFDTNVVRQIHKAKNDQMANRLMSLQSKRVRVTDTRICPQCHKRIGPSVIAVHAPRGEVTHFHCREAFSSRLKTSRH